MLAFSAAKSTDGTAAASPHTKVKPRGMLTSAQRQLAASGCMDPSEIELPETLSDGESDREVGNAHAAADAKGSQAEAAGGAVAMLASHVGGRAWRSHIKVLSWLLALTLNLAEPKGLGPEVYAVSVLAGLPCGRSSLVTHSGI